jgi:hypothetical protein
LQDKANVLLWIELTVAGEIQEHVLLCHWLARADCVKKIYQQEGIISTVNIRVLCVL